MQRCGSVWSASPGVVLAVALAAGIWWSDHVGVGARAGFLMLAAGMILALPVVHRSVRRAHTLRPLARVLLALGLAFACGTLRAGSGGLPPLTPEESPEVERRAVHIEARVALVARSTSGTRRVLLEDLRLASARKMRGSVLVYLSDHVPDPPVGATITTKARLLPFPTARNPGEFDYGRYLARRGVHILARALDTLRVKDPPGLVDRVTAAGRRFVETTLQTYVATSESRTLLRALLLGDRSDIASDLRESFVVTGLVHLLAVSGLHVMIVGLLLYRLSGPLLMRTGLRWPLVEPIRTGLTLFVLLGYAMLTGTPTSVVRAVSMTAVLLVGPVVRRRSHSINSLGVAAILILWTQPHSLFEPGFQLSVSAVGGIILLVPRIEWVASRLAGRDASSGPVATGLFVSTAATLATLPVLLVHFGRASFAGIPLNVLAIPLTAAALCASMLCLLFAPLPAAAAAFGAAADVCIQLLVALAAKGSSLLSVLAVTAVPGPLVPGLLVAGLVALYCVASRAQIIRIAVIAVLFLAAWRGRPLYSAEPLRVLFFDVGQGDAALVMTPSGKCFLVDAGPASDRFDSGTRIIIPYLSRQAIRRLDAVILTHAHADHIGGAAALLRGVDVGRLVITPTTHTSGTMNRVQLVADSAGVNTTFVGRGDTLVVDPNVRIFVLGPSAGALSTAGENDRSIILRIEYGNSSLLLLGDAEELSELDLLERYREILEADVIKVGHHGSSTSSHKKFVSAAVPSLGSESWAIVSVARRNRYRHPSPIVLRRWEDAGAQTLTTFGEGAVLFTIDGRSVRRVNWRREDSSD